MPRTNRVKLSEAKVRDFKTPGFLRDSEAPGLGVRLTANGAKTYFVERRIGKGGAPVRIVIGPCGGTSLEKARKEAQKLIEQLKGGIDPRQVKAEEKAAEEREGMTGLDAWKAYAEAHEGVWSERHKRDQGYLVRPAEKKKRQGILRPLLEKKIVDIDQAAVITWAKAAKATYAKRYSKAQAEAKKEDGKGTNMRGRNNALIRGRIALRSFWRWMSEHPDQYGELVHPDVLFGNSDLKALVPKGGVRKDCLERGQLSEWFKAVQAQPNRTTSIYLQCLLLLGCRRRELSRLKWGHVDFKWGVVWLHDKTEQETGRKVPLTKFVAYLLTQLPKGKDDHYVFASDSKAGYIQEPTPAHRKACAAAGLPPISLHALRRSFGQLSEWCEIPTGIVAEIQGHKPSALIEKHYRSRPLDLLKIWHQRFETWILEQAEIAFNPETVDGKLKVVSDEETA